MLVKGLVILALKLELGVSRLARLSDDRLFVNPLSNISRFEDIGTAGFGSLKAWLAILNWVG